MHRIQLIPDTEQKKNISNLTVHNNKKKSNNKNCLAKIRQNDLNYMLFVKHVPDREIQSSKLS